MTQDRSTIHAFFECAQCHLKWECYLTAEDLATKHYQETGHVISGEVVVSVLIR